MCFCVFADDFNINTIWQCLPTRGSGEVLWRAQDTNTPGRIQGHLVTGLETG